MVQFHVLRCFSCESFQVQQVKKVNRWSCKVCGEKQSLLKEFGRGSGADCRRHVQRLNAIRGAMIEEHEHNTWMLWKQGEASREEPDDQANQTRVSRWSKYLDAPEEAEQRVEPEEDNVLMDRQQLHGNNMIDRKRKRADTPTQSSCFSLMRKPVRPSTTSATQSSTTQSSPTQSSTPSTTQSSPTRSSISSVSKWTRFLGSAYKEQEGGECYVSGQSIDRATSLSCGVVTTKPRPLLPGSLMFETKEEFSFNDEDFLSNQRL